MIISIHAEKNLIKSSTIKKKKTNKLGLERNLFPIPPSKGHFQNFYS